MDDASIQSGNRDLIGYATLPPLTVVSVPAIWNNERLSIGARLELPIMRVYKKIALFRSQFSMSLPPWQCGEYHSGVTGTHSNTEEMLILTTLLSGRVYFILFLGNHLDTSPRNARYLSPQIQNELICCLGDEICESNVKQIKKSKFLA